MDIRKLVLTGNVLLAIYHQMVAAWLLTEEGLVDGAPRGKRASRDDNIWAIPLIGHPTFLVEDRTVVLKWGGSIHAYHTGTGEVLEPAQAPLPQPYPSPPEQRDTLGNQYSLHDMLYGRHHLHYRDLDAHDTHFENDWPVSKTTLQEGWVKDPEGRHRMWIPVEWRTSCYYAGWLCDITTLWFNFELRYRVVIVKF